jgi:hypothetical protein
MKAKTRRIVRAAALGLVLAAWASLAALPSAAAKVPDPKAAATSDIQVPSMLEVKRYLRSLGVDPRGVVIQRGSKNYAGPNCPGPEWNCTTATKVVQLSPTRASRGADGDGANRFVCKKQRGTGGVVTRDTTPPDVSCFVLQPGGSSNSATCDIRMFGLTGTITQTCFITQGGASNNAVARLFAAMGSGGGDQNIRQRIEIKQTGGSAGNTLDASETAALRAGNNTTGGGRSAGDGSPSAYQDFNQVICGNQSASGGGSNTATVKQEGRASVTFSNAGQVDIEQNLDSIASVCTAGTATTGGAGPFDDLLGAGHDPLKCAVVGGRGLPKNDANACARIQQDAVSGSNRLTRQEQTSLLLASVDGANDVEIDQGTIDGGMEATQDQQSGGVSSIVDVQDVDQIARVSNATGVVEIRQIEDPRCCSHQFDNPANTWSIAQDLNQKAYVDGQLLNPNNLPTGIGILQLGADYGHCESSGNCAVDQRVSNNAQTRTDSESGTTVDSFISCLAGEGTTGPPGGGACLTDEDID